MDSRTGVGMQQYDDVALSYEQWIAPRYRVVADGLVWRCPIGPRDRVVEVAAGTGVLTRAFAGAGQWPARYLLTDISPGMLQIARAVCEPLGSGLSFIVADCARLPLGESRSDVVLSALGPVQDRLRWVRELRRVLRPGGRVGIAMWGPRYTEVRLHNRVRAQVGLRPFPPADAAGAVRRLVQAGFVEVCREDVQLPAVHATPDAYLAYRRSFGRPKAWSEETYHTYYKILSQHLAQRFGEGPVALDWTITYIVARAHNDRLPTR